MWMILAALAVSCPDGCAPYEGNCACEATTEKTTPAEGVQPSDEKPPRSGMPAWQDPDIKADMRPSEAANDEKLDRERTNADFEGKKAAGL